MADCACSTAPTLIFPCSGGSDCGAVSDQAARTLTKNGVGKMYCLAGLGGDVAPIIANAKAAGKILAIDGCNLDCAKKTIERVGLAVTAHIRMSDLGMEKGKTPANEANIAVVANAGRAALAKAG
ncbi:MAG: putative zinc-binding protein [Aestuariivirga sp.]